MSSSIMSAEAAVDAATVVAADAAAQRTGTPSRMFALMPLWVFIVVSTFSTEFFTALRVMPPDILGYPAAIVIEIAALLWMLVGVIVISYARSRLIDSLALTVFTIPATVVVVLTPAMIGMVQNQG
jgi:hypothetical protein